MNSDISIVQYLHQAEADITIRDKYGRTAVLWAARWGHRDIVEYLHQARLMLTSGTVMAILQ